jgi:hypothetical protein
VAEIHVERKPRSGWAWVWVLLLLVAIGVLAWLYWPDRVGTRTTETATATDPAMGGDPSVVDTVPLPGATQPSQSMAMISEIRANPEQWIGREFVGVVNVTDSSTTDETAMPPERGFWIEQDGERLFVLVNDDPNRTPVAVTPGQPIRIRGTVRDATFIPQLGAMNLSGEADELLRSEPAYLVAEESAIELAQESTQMQIQTQTEQPPASTP